MNKQRGAENIEKKKKTVKMKTLKNDEKEKRRIQGKLNNNNKNFLWLYILYKKYILLESIACKKAVYAITFYLQFLHVAGFLKHVRINQGLIYINIQITI